MFLVSRNASATQPGADKVDESGDKKLKLPWAFTGSAGYEKLKALQICMADKAKLPNLVQNELKTEVKEKTPDEAKVIIAAYLKAHCFRGKAHIERCETEKKEYVAALKKIDFNTTDFESEFNNSVTIAANYYKATAVLILKYLVNNTRGDLGHVNFDKMNEQLLELVDNPEKAAEYEFNADDIQFLHTTARDSKAPGPGDNLYYPVAQFLVKVQPVNLPKSKL